MCVAFLERTLPCSHYFTIKYNRGVEDAVIGYCFPKMWVFKCNGSVAVTEDILIKSWQKERC